MTKLAIKHQRKAASLLIVVKLPKTVQFPDRPMPQARKPGRRLQGE